MNSIRVVVKRLNIIPIMIVFLLFHLAASIGQMRVTEDDSLLEIYYTGSIVLSVIYAMFYSVIKSRFGILYPEFRMYPIKGARVIRLLLFMMDLVTCCLVLITGIVTIYFGKVHNLIATVCCNLIIQLFIYILLSKGIHYKFEDENGSSTSFLIIGITGLKCLEMIISPRLSETTGLLLAFLSILVSIILIVVRPMIQRKIYASVMTEVSD